MITSSAPLTLLFDADDTLWQNNVYFERAIAAFISFLDHRTHTPEEVRERLNACERATIAERGYGVESFRHSLVRCFEQLSTAPSTPETHRQVVSFANAIAEADIELLPGVTETLAELGMRHRLMLVTKGNDVEQRNKLRRSGLEAMFSAVEVLPEKHEAAYRALAQHHALDPRHTWMIGNSPKSDINPALAAGLHAVYVPHGSTWVLEHDDLHPPPAGQELLEVARIHDLLTRF